MISFDTCAALMNQAGANLSKVSKDTGIPLASLCDWQRGRSVPKAEKLLAIARYFGVSVEYIMTGKDPVKVRSVPEAALEAGEEINKKPALFRLYEAAKDLPDYDVEVLRKLAVYLAERRQ